MPISAEASELVWRSDRVTTSQASIRQPSSTSSTSNNSTSALRFVRPSTLHNDPSVRQAAFDDNAPQLTSGHATETQTRSVVVNRDDASDSVRSAQLQSPGTTSRAGGGPSTGEMIPQPLEQPGTPFGDGAGPPQLQTPKLETPSGPETNLTQPVPPGNSLQPLEAPPGQQPLPNPAEQPPAAGTGSGQFQPVLPSGPNVPDVSGGPPGSVPAVPTATLDAEHGKATESCDQSLKNLKAYTVDKVNLNIMVKGTEGQDYPFECSIDEGQMLPARCWDQTTYMWKASAMCHKPLYFEDEQLERYGHSFTPCFQPIISGAHFFCTLPVLPYCMGVEPPCECIYALGYYRPGSCAPYMCNPIPLSPRGALFEAGAVTGAAMALP